jgi:hypothetical protein
MDENNFGIEQFDGEDGAYKGSRFSEVRDVIFANPYQKIWGGAGEPPIPVYQTTLSSVLRGILSFGKKYLFGQAAARIIDSHADLRWGPDKKGYRRIVHPNGVCLTGRWSITEDTGYSGYFANGSQALAIARYSASKPNRGETGRSIGIAGKLYPTTDSDHAEPLRPAGFVAQEDICGDNTRYINDAELRNAPDVTLTRAGFVAFPVAAMAGIVFTITDKIATQRQLYEIAELGKPPREPTKCPAYMRLLMTADTPRLEGENLDIRDEVLGQMFDKGDPAPKRKLAFHIEITDDGTEFALLGFTKRTFKNWRRIGTLSFDDAVASFNGDHVVHFHHPGWRDDRNDPATAHRRAPS